LQAIISSSVSIRIGFNADPDLDPVYFASVRIQIPGAKPIADPDSGQTLSLQKVGF
jgi:hypothetical protein